MAGDIVTSCPLCLALCDPDDMVVVEIERLVPKGRTHVLLDRLCCSAVVRAMANRGEPLAKDLIELDKKEAERPPASDESKNSEAGSIGRQNHEAGAGPAARLSDEEPDDGKSAA